MYVEDVLTRYQQQLVSLCLCLSDSCGHVCSFTALLCLASFSGLGLLVYNYISNESLSEAAVATRLHSRAQLVETGLQLAVRNVRLVGEELSAHPALTTRPG